jgi:hypothetical protein
MAAWDLQNTIRIWRRRGKAGQWITRHLCPCQTFVGSQHLGRDELAALLMREYRLLTSLRVRVVPQSHSTSGPNNSTIQQYRKDINLIFSFVNTSQGRVADTSLIFLF